LPEQKVWVARPVGASGKSVTVIVKIADVAGQCVALPSVTVYVILAEPAETGVTTPVLFTVATPVFDEAQVYVNVPVPVAFEDRESVPPIQTAVSPVIAPATGKAFIVTVTGEIDEHPSGVVPFI
jgi:hypothetical protein